MPVHFLFIVLFYMKSLICLIYKSHLISNTHLSPQLSKISKYFHFLFSVQSWHKYNWFHSMPPFTRWNLVMNTHKNLIHNNEHWYFILSSPKINTWVLLPHNISLTWLFTSLSNIISISIATNYHRSQRFQGHNHFKAADKPS